MDVKLNVFPSSDREFAAYARAAWDGLSEPRTPADLQQALRARYPTAVATAQSQLARHGDGPAIVYAFRTAIVGPEAPGAAGASDAPNASPTPGGDAPPLDSLSDADLPDARGSDAAWAILDDERRFLEVSPALARIVELPGRRIVGHRIEEFSNPADPTVREDIARLWEEFLGAGSIASTVRFNYGDGRPRELAYRIVAHVDGAGRHLLTVRPVP